METDSDRRARPLTGLDSILAYLEWAVKTGG